VLVLLLVVHLFLPERLMKYDPLDRLYRRIDPVEQPKKPPKFPPSGPREPGVPQP